MHKNRTRAFSAIVATFVLSACSVSNETNPSMPNHISPGSSTAIERAGTMPHVTALCGPARPGEARCFALMRTDRVYLHPPAYEARRDAASPDEMAAEAQSGFFGPLGPQQLQQAYNLPSKTGGKGQTVGIVDAYDNPSAESDLAKYRKAFKLPPCTTANGCFKKLNQRGNTSPLPVPNAGWAGEISLDLDMVSAICPNCHIVLVEASKAKIDDLGAAVLTAAKQGAAQISNSYGAAECYYDRQGQDVCQSPMTFAHYYAIANTIITASTGDGSWFSGPQAPASFDTVVAVGGTSIYPYNNARGWLESAWTYSGSSCSRFVKSPSWIPSGSIKCPKGTRPLSDVSAVADPYTGVLIYRSFGVPAPAFYVAGGTSAASPIVASIYALAGNSASQNYGAALYKATARSMTDVTIGKNGVPGVSNNAGQECTPIEVCVASPGWDGPTGNGTPWGIGAF